VYAGAEALFTSLSEELKKYTDWVALGSAGDLDELLDSQLQEVADWEANLKMLKAAAREAERLPNMVGVVDTGWSSWGLGWCHVQMEICVEQTCLRAPTW
jgi:hypothetical protein